jgi:hypothetical protein
MLCCGTLRQTEELTCAIRFSNRSTILSADWPSSSNSGPKPLQNAAEGVVVDITLKGAKPAAKVLGLTIPQSLLARSDEWIR